MNFRSLDHSRAELERALSGASGPGWLIARTPAPPRAARRLVDGSGGSAIGFTAGSGSAASVDADEDGVAYVGWGASVTFQARGESRFSSIQKQLEAFALEHPELREVRGLRFFGGASFLPGEPTGDGWDDFGQALFVLPRLLYIDYGVHAELIVVTSEAERSDDLTLAAVALERANEGQVSIEPAPSLVSEQSSLGPAEFEALVSAIQRGIAQGSFEKVVAARRLNLELSKAPRLADLLARLEEAEPSSARFLLRRGQSTFVGATPERLVRLRGRSVETEAVAGSISSSADGAAERLLSSAKDLAEHRVVVEAIHTALGSCVAELVVPPEPELRVLRRILHLRTPIVGTLDRQRHVLELVERLHPTPAVGGFPQAPALDFIRDHEPVSRGWYAGPFGWVDLAGNGEFVVALRSALLRGPSAQIYAGAGIVGASKADEEYAETELKMGVMLGALGLRA